MSPQPSLRDERISSPPPEQPQSLGSPLGSTVLLSQTPSAHPPSPIPSPDFSPGARWGRSESLGERLLLRDSGAPAQVQQPPAAPADTSSPHPTPRGLLDHSLKGSQPVSAPSFRRRCPELERRPSADSSFLQN